MFRCKTRTCAVRAMVGPCVRDRGMQPRGYGASIHVKGAATKATRKAVEEVQGFNQSFSAPVGVIEGHLTQPEFHKMTPSASENPVIVHPNNHMLPLGIPHTWSDETSSKPDAEIQRNEPEEFIARLKEVFGTSKKAKSSTKPTSQLSRDSIRLRPA